MYTGEGGVKVLGVPEAGEHPGQLWGSPILTPHLSFYGVQCTDTGFPPAKVRALIHISVLLPKGKSPRNKYTRLRCLRFIKYKAVLTGPGLLLNSSFAFLSTQLRFLPVLLRESSANVTNLSALRYDEPKTSTAFSVAEGGFISEGPQGSY